MPEENLANMCGSAFVNQCRAYVHASGQSLVIPPPTCTSPFSLQVGSLGFRTRAWGALAWTRPVFLQTRRIQAVPSTWQSECKPGLRCGLERQSDARAVSIYGQTSLRSTLSDNFPSTLTFWGLSLSQSISNSVYCMLIWRLSSSFEHMSSGTTYVPCKSLLQ